MTSLLLTGATLYTPRDRLNRAWLLIRDGRIEALGQGGPPDAPNAHIVDCTGRTVAPGFVDLHTHGAGGADLMDATADAIRTIARAHAAGGTTTWFGTTVAAPLDETRHVLDAARPLIGRPLDGATLAGIHLEGPFLAHSQCGAHRPEHLRAATPSEYEPLLEALLPAGSHRLTAAPEVPGRTLRSGRDG